MPILLLSDIHANLEALDAVLADAGDFEHIWCLGDVVGYGADPNRCIARLQEFDITSVAGNHDWGALGKLDTGDFNSTAQQALSWTRGQLTEENRAWLAALPERIKVNPGSFTLVHASPRSPIWEYVVSAKVAQENFSFFDTLFCLLGHSHIPLVFRFDPSSGAVTSEQWTGGGTVTLGLNRIILNPGSVGQPRDGDRRASYGLVDMDKYSIEVRRVAYDIREAQAKIIRAGLPPRLAERLSYGQ